MNTAERQRVAYIVSRFPKLSETFILQEMDALEQRGVQIDVFPFIRLQEAVHHPEAERWLARLDRADRPWEIVLANVRWLGASPRCLIGLYALVVRHLWRQPGDLARGMLALLRAPLWASRVRARQITHVHAHFALHPTVAALAVSALTGVPFSFTCHAQDVYRRPAMLGEKVRRARFVVAISFLLRDWYLAPLLADGDQAKIHVIRCGVDLTRYQCRMPCPASGVTTLLAVARLTEKKGLRYLIEACDHLRARGRPFRCRIIGAGPLQEELNDEISRRALDNLVLLEGPRTQEEVRAALQEADIFVQASVVTADGDMEGVPVSLMEAMAVGVPVIATRSGAIPELVEDGVTGLLIPPADSIALAAAIVRMIDAPDRARQLLVAEARRRIEEQYDVHAGVGKLEQLFEGSVSLAVMVSNGVASPHVG